MENFANLLIPAVLVLVFVRLIALPLKLAGKLLLHSGCALVCLGLLNLISGITGLHFPINAVTLAAAGFLGLPGMALMALVQLLPPV